MARTGMQTLIDTVRGFANAAPDEWEVSTDSSIVTYWSDDEIQRVLDRHKIQHIHSQLDLVTNSGGKLYVLGDTEIEEDDRFELYDGKGTVADGYTVEFGRGIVTFATDQGGKAYYWNGFSYDLNAAAAEIWRAKAAHAADLVDWSSDNHSVKKSQLVTAYTKMADTFAARSKSEGMKVVKIVRDDL